MYSTPRVPAPHRRVSIATDGMQAGWWLVLWLGSSADGARLAGAAGGRSLIARTSVLRMVSQEDAESNARLMAALFGSVEEAEEQLKKDPDVSSHLQVCCRRTIPRLRSGRAPPPSPSLYVHSWIWTKMASPPS